MPNRIIREAINSSDPVDGLSAPSEVFYRRLLNVVDDFGRFDARTSMLISGCFPLRIDGPRRVRAVDISRWVHECAAAGLVVLYEAAGKVYLLVTKFDQQIRAKTSKYPEPPVNIAESSARLADDKQTISKGYARAYLDGDVVVDVSVSGGVDGIASDPKSPEPTLNPNEPPVGVTGDTWAAWRRHRGKKLTPDALRLQRKHLAEWAEQGHDPNAIVERAVANGWQGLHPGEKPGPKPGQRGTRPTSLADRRASKIDNIVNGTGPSHERDISGTAERVDSTAVEATPVDLREPGRGRLRNG